MREIKFRVWHKSAHAFLYCLTEMFIDSGPQGIHAAKFISNLGDEIIINAEDLIFLQYTGIKDENKKEAYHKDIVSAYGYSNWIIEWNKSGWMLKQIGVDNYQRIPEHFIIYANAYENPELLEKK